MKIGLVGWDVTTGLGQYNQDLARHLGVFRWLVPKHPHFSAPAAPPLPVCIRTSLAPAPSVFRDFLDGLDWLLFVETPYFPALPRLAALQGVRVVAIPMAENFDPAADWVAWVDLMLPPTRHCERLLRRSRQEHGWGWRLAYVPGAVDVGRFVFRPRTVCRRYLFSNGRGGYAGRKGAACIVAAAQMVPDVSLLVYTQTDDLPVFPDNVEVRPATERPEDLYGEGDVCVQPSRWEGLGLSLLEAQACGLPLVTTDGPPMTEYKPYRRIMASVGEIEIGERRIAAYDASPDDLARLLRDLWHQDISSGSQAARRFVSQKHSWAVALPRIEDLLRTTGKRAGKRGRTAQVQQIGPILTPSSQSQANSRQELLPFIPLTARRILELGCGAGEFGALVKARQPAEVIGIDRAAVAATAARRCLDFILIADVELLSNDDFPAGPFDCIVCGRLLERIREPERLLEKARTRLKSGGCLLARVGNLRHHANIAAMVEGALPGEEAGEDNKQLRFYTRREIEKLFDRAGFRTDTLQAVPGLGHDAWQKQGCPATVQVGGLEVCGLPPADVEEFYTSHYLVSATPAPPPTFGLTSIVILTRNQLAYTRACVDSIRFRTDEPYELLFVDNGSTDGTPDYLRSVPGVRVIVNQNNRGFPAAANQGIRAARGDQVLLLNNDCVVTTGWLRRLLRALNADPRIGLVGPCSNRISGEQQVAVDYDEDLTSLDGFAWEWGKKHDATLVDADRLVGFCLLIRRVVIDRIGLLDERFGIGCFEDDDYCRRALRAGFRAVIAQDAFVHHFGGRTFVAEKVDFARVMSDNERLYREKWDEDDQPNTPSWAGPQIPVTEVPTNASAGPFTLRVAGGGGLLLMPAAPRLSLCMIVRDNARTITACLESIRPWVDEMIVVDTGSKDDTPQIVKRLGARLFHFPWCDSFAAARNESLRHARGTWIFWMDSDDTIDAANGRQLRALTSMDVNPTRMGYVMQVHCPGPGDQGKADVTVVDHVKLIRNRSDLRFEGRIHEQILPSIRRAGGEVSWTSVFVVHTGYDHSPEGQARKLERDLRLLHRELEEQPEHPFTLFNLGMTYADQGKFDEAEDFLHRSIAAAGPGDSHLRKAHALLVYSQAKAGRLAAAIASCAEALLQFPRDVELRFRQAVLLQESGQMRAAVQVYQDILDDPGERHFTSVDRGITGFKARQNLAVVFTELGELASAEMQWRRIVTEEPHYRAGWRGLGECLVKQRQHDEALVVAGRMTVGDWLGAEARLLRAAVATDRGKLDETRQELQAAVHEAPDDLDVWQAWCRFLFESASSEVAAQALAELVRRSPADAAAYHNLGLTYLRLGRHSEAASAFRQSLALRPHSPVTHQLLEQIAPSCGTEGESNEPDRTQIVALMPRLTESHGRHQDRRVHIINAHLGRGYGLDRHTAILREALEVVGYEVAVGHNAAGLGKGWVNIHLEHLRPEVLGHAAHDLFIPMPEHFCFEALLPRVRAVLACTRQAEEAFARLGVPTHFLGFASEDRRVSDQPETEKWLHAAGASSTKNTQAVLDCWARNPTFPPLVVVYSGDWEFQIPRAAHIEVRRGRLPDAEMLDLQNGCRVHLCPSEAEGWGHYILEGMSTQAVVVTTDAPPMNEHVTPNRGVLVRPASRRPRGVVDSHSIDPDDLAAVVRRVLKMKAGERTELGLAARQYALRQRDEFPARLGATLAQYS